MRKIKWWLAVPLLLCCGQVAQGQGCTGYGFNPTDYALLMPNDEAAQGKATATVWLQNGLPSSLNSHNATETQNTWVGFGWSGICPSGHTCSASTYFTVDADPTHQQEHGATLNGTNYHAWTTGTNDIGHIYHQHYIVSDQTTGIATQDINNLTVTSGTDNTIVDQDEIPTNLYWRAIFSFGGGSMVQNCQQCIDFPSSCTGSHHTPYFDGGLENPQSGETQLVNHVVAGQTVGEGEPISGSWRFDLSVLPGDSPEPDPTSPPTGEIFCTAILGDIFDQGNPDHYTYKVMKTKIKISQQGSTTAGVTRWYVDSWCKDTQHTPIWEPLYIDTYGGITPLIKVGQYEISEQDCYAEPGWPAWKCPPITVTPPQPLHIGVGGTKYDCSTLLNTPLPK